MKVLGITGGIGSGKSVVAGILNKEFGVSVIDADALARRAVEPGSLGLSAVVEAFGTTVLRENGSLDRKALGSIVFRDEDKRRQLNAIVHPQVERLFYQALEEEENKGATWVVYDCPLLVEEKLFHQADQIWLVRATDETRIQRIVQRNAISREDAMARMEAQMPDDEKEPFVHVVLWNDGSLESLRNTVLQLWAKYFKIHLSIE
jgi:dephospho-CoA kinase